jgi:clan AA aspartic protease (TIGR02281 family)
LNERKSFNFIVDTGASVSIIDESVAAFLGFDVKQLRSEYLTTIGGKTNAKILKLPEIKLFGKTVTDFEVKIMTLPFQITLLADGLIGMDFLLKFKSFNVDFKTETIEIQ